MTADISIQQWFEGREDIRAAFLRDHGFAGARLEPVGEDAAFRRYYRVRAPQGNRILMDTIPDGAAIATPGHSMQDFIRIGTYLREIGLHTPAIEAADKKNGFLLLEDFGDVSFRIAWAQGVPAADLYAQAVDILVYLREKAARPPIPLPSYYESHVHKGRRRVVDWYMPLARGQRNADGLAEEYLAVWNAIERGLPPAPSGFLHIDFHFENLMWMPQQQGIARDGILDFQGAMLGPVPYDLANLLEDARVDVPQELRAAMLEKFCAAMEAAERERFLAWYRVLATQFHCRVMGQFIRIALRDGKKRYLPHLPRVAGYIAQGLEDPLLAPLQAWFAAQGINFAAFSQPDLSRAKELIRADAF
jgi:aminoglycoside/choline kinase family phosphotransferase